MNLDPVILKRVAVRLRGRLPTISVELATFLAIVRACGYRWTISCGSDSRRATCLALECAARRARHYGGVVGVCGGLIGPEGTLVRLHGSARRYPRYVGLEFAQMYRRFGTTLALVSGRLLGQARRSPAGGQPACQCGVPWQSGPCLLAKWATLAARMAGASFQVSLLHLIALKPVGFD
jgi:hypothetical protein